MNTLVLIAQLVAPTLALPAIPPGPLATMPNVTVRYYDVPGRREGEIRSNMNALRPRDPTNPDQGHAALTRSVLQIRWIGSADTPCRATVREAAHRTTVTLPRLIEEDRLDRRTRARWLSFIEATELHEKGHVQITAEQVPGLAARLDGTPCEAMPAAIEQARREIEVLQDAYDRATEHGRTQQKF